MTTDVGIAGIVVGRTGIAVSEVGGGGRPWGRIKGQSGEHGQSERA
jgi:hypothetical protein